MKKIIKEKLEFESLFTKYDSFMMDSLPKIKPDSGFSFVISIKVLSKSSVENDYRNKYYHDKFLMIVESKMRGLLI